MTKRYIGTKVILAWPESKKVADNSAEPTLENPMPLTVESGYAVKYPDGYISWSPTATFEGAYRVVEGEGQALTFGDALHFLKLGKRVCRAGWNGKGMWLSLSVVNGSKTDYETHLPAAGFWSDNNRKYAEENGGYAVVLPCITMKTATGEILMGWLASQTDMLSEDWQVLP